MIDVVSWLKFGSKITSLSVLLALSVTLVQSLFLQVEPMPTDASWMITVWLGCGLCGCISVLVCRARVTALPSPFLNPTFLARWVDGDCDDGISRDLSSSVLIRSSLVCDMMND